MKESFRLQQSDFKPFKVDQFYLLPPNGEAFHTFVVDSPRPGTKEEKPWTHVTSIARRRARTLRLKRWIRKIQGY